MTRFTPRNTGFSLFALEKVAHAIGAVDEPAASVPCWRTPQPEPHAHEDHEINLVVEGSALYEWEDPAQGFSRTLVRSGQAFIIPGGVSHIVHVERRAVVHGMWIHPTCVSPTAPMCLRSWNRPPSSKLVADPLLFSELHELFLWCEREAKRRDLHSSDARSALGRYAAVGFQRALAASETSTTHSSLDRVRAVHAWLDRHYLQGPSLGELACRAGLGRSRFCQLFRQVAGVPPGEYLLRLKVRHAQDLLVNSTDSVAAIAETCGFSDPPAFTRAFSQATGMSPTRFRTIYQTFRTNSSSQGRSVSSMVER